MNNKGKVPFTTRMQIIFWSAVGIAFICIFFGGSAVLKNYNSSSSSSTTESVYDGVEDIEYNSDLVAEMTGGYTGAPELVGNDGKVFYIPPEYCNGSYLKNFRVIGVNASNISIDKKGNISGLVILYGFQTTYKADYGSGYNFDYEPYDYNVEYIEDDTIIDEYLKKLNGEDSGEAETAEETAADENSEEESYSFEASGSVNITENENAVDDSDFKVATVVMEHRVGSDYNTILYCDSGSCTVADLSLGQYNLVTSLNDDALTVCYNNAIYVYSFNSKETSYGENEAYCYSLTDLFNSKDFLNLLSVVRIPGKKDKFYADTSYTVEAKLDYSNTSTGWVGTWLNKMTKTKTLTVDNVSEFSNIEGDSVSLEWLKAHLKLDMEDFIYNALETGYSGYKKTTSGWLSYKHETYIDEDELDNFKYQANNDSWIIRNDSFTYNLQETSWLILAPKTYKGSATGSAVITITPNYTLNEEYNYNISDMILTKNDASDNKIDYSIIIQLMITSKENNVSEDVDENVLKPIENFDDFAKAYVVSDDELLEEKDFDDEEMSEEALEEQIANEYGGQYITMNIRLSQTSGEKTDSTLEISSITGGEELAAYFSDKKTEAKDYYNSIMAEYKNESTSGGDVIPRDFNVTSMEEFLEDFGQIRAAKQALEEAKQKKEDIEEYLEAQRSVINTYAKNLNALYDKAQADYSAILPKSTNVYDDFGLYEGCFENLEYFYSNREAAPELYKFSSMYNSTGRSENQAVSSFYSSLRSAIRLFFAKASSIDKDFEINEYCFNNYSNFYNYVSNYGIGIFRVKPPDASALTAKTMIFYHYLYADSYNKAYPGSSFDCNAYTLSKYGTYTAKCLLSLNTTYLQGLLSEITNMSTSAYKSESGFIEVYNDVKNVFERAERVYNYGNEKKALIENKKVYGYAIYESDTAINEYSTEYEKLKILYNNFIDYAEPYYEFYTAIKNIRSGGTAIADLINQYDKVRNSIFMYSFIESGYNNSSYESYMAEYGISYDDMTLPEAEDLIEACQAKLDTLIEEHDSKTFYIDFYWKNEKLDGQALSDLYESYDEISKYILSYISAYTSFSEPVQYKTSSDKFISDIITLNTSTNLQEAFSYIDFALMGREEDYGNGSSSFELLYNNLGKYYYGINSSINRLANISSEALIIETAIDTALTEEFIENDANKGLIKEYVEKYFSSYGKNAIAKLTVSDIDSLCNNVYEKLYNSFSTISATDENGSEYTYCDVTTDTVREIIYYVLVKEYNISVLKNEEGDTARSLYTSSVGGVSITEASADEAQETTETYLGSAAAIYSSYNSIAEYTAALSQHFGNISLLATDFLVGTGSLNEEQIAITDAGNSIDKDVTSLYNSGYKLSVDTLEEMTGLLPEVKEYYEGYKTFVSSIKNASSGGLKVVKRDDLYYWDYYLKQCSQIDDIYTLVYKASQAVNQKKQSEYESYVAQYEELCNSNDLIVDIALSADLLSVFKVETHNIKTRWQSVIWNTASIYAKLDTDLGYTNVTSTPYSLYQMNSNFCVGIKDADGNSAASAFIIPIGYQVKASKSVMELNYKILNEMKEFSSLNNVAYGSVDGNDVILFSGEDSKGNEYAYMVIAKPINGNEPGYDTKNIAGYKGTYNLQDILEAEKEAAAKAASNSADGETDTASSSDSNDLDINTDVHFLEYNNTMIVGPNQFYTTTLEKGYKAYSMKPAKDGTLSINYDDSVEVKSGAYFNSWSVTKNGKGYVVLLGFTDEDRKIDSNSEEDEEGKEDDEDTEDDEDAEDNKDAKPQYREITETDLYDAHIYVLSYDTVKGSVTEIDENEDTINTGGIDTLLGDYYIEGEYAPYVNPVVSIMEYFRAGLLVIVYALAALYCIRLGIKYSKAGTDEELHKAKEHIKWAILAFLIIHILIAVLIFSGTQLKQWANGYVIEEVTETATETEATDTDQ